MHVYTSTLLKTKLLEKRKISIELYPVSAHVHKAALEETEKIAKELN